MVNKTVNNMVNTPANTTRTQQWANRKHAHSYAGALHIQYHTCRYETAHAAANPTHPDIDVL